MEKLHDQQMKKISKFSNVIRIITKIAMYLLAFMLMIAIALPFLGIDSLDFHIEEIEIPGDHISTPILLLALVILLINFVIMEIGLYHLYKLFSLYTKCQIFVSESIRRIRYLGFTVMLWAFGNFITEILKFIMIAQLPTEYKHTATFQLNAGDWGFLQTLFFGIIIILISWVMDEGRKIKEDSDLTI